LGEGKEFPFLAIDVALPLAQAGPVVVEQAHNPRTLELRGRIRGIAHDYQHRQILLDLVGGVRFVGHPLGKKRQTGVLVGRFQGVRQVDTEALITSEVVRPIVPLFRWQGPTCKLQS